MPIFMQIVMRISIHINFQFAHLKTRVETAEILTKKSSYLKNVFALD